MVYRSPARRKRDGRVSPCDPDAEELRADARMFVKEREDLLRAVDGCGQVLVEDELDGDRAQTRADARAGTKGVARPGFVAELGEDDDFELRWEVVPVLA